MIKRVKENAMFVSFLLVCIVWFTIRIMELDGNLICNDGEIYYGYFVRTLIDGNLVGSGMIKFPVGTTLLQLPFLMSAYISCKIFNIDLEGGYNIVFQRAVFFAALFYFCLAFILIYSYLKKYFTERVIVFTCICLACGTMIPVYVTTLSSMSHIYGFFVCTLFFFYVDWYEKRYISDSKRKKIILDLVLGMILGLVTLVRNTDIIIGFAYLLYNVDSREKFVSRIKILFSKKILKTF